MAEHAVSNDEIVKDGSNNGGSKERSGIGMMKRHINLNSESSVTSGDSSGYDSSHSSANVDHLGPDPKRARVDYRTFSSSNSQLEHSGISTPPPDDFANNAGQISPIGTGVFASGQQAISPDPVEASNAGVLIGTGERGQNPVYVDVEYEQGIFRVEELEEMNSDMSNLSTISSASDQLMSILETPPQSNVQMENMEEDENFDTLFQSLENTEYYEQNKSLYRLYIERLKRQGVKSPYYGAFERNAESAPSTPRGHPKREKTPYEYIAFPRTYY